MSIPIDDKERVLASLAHILVSERTPYALIGGVAVQFYIEEPRATADIDVALPRPDWLPSNRLIEAGFSYAGEHDWTENWRAPAGPGKKRLAIQFSIREEMAGVVDRGIDVDVGFPLRIAALPDLIQLKLDAAGEKSRRLIKRKRDMLDVEELLEVHPEQETPWIRRRILRIAEMLARVVG